MMGKFGIGREDFGGASRSDGHLSRLEAVSFCLVIASLQLLIFRYRYANSSQLELICQVKRFLDPTFLANDVYIDTMVAFGPRYYFGLAMAFLSQHMTVTAAFLLITWLSHVGIVLATYWAARRIFRSGQPAALLACILVLAVESFDFGGACYLRQSFLHSRLPALPFELLALGLGVGRAPILCVLAAGAGGLIHPAAVFTGAVALAVAAIPEGVRLVVLRGRTPGETVSYLVRCVAASVVFVVYVYFFWMRRYEHNIGDDLLVHIYAIYRCPHHYVASTFAPRDWFALGSFLASGGFLWAWWFQDEPDHRRVTWRVLLMAGIVLATCVGGYVFIELIPSRTWVSINAYRLLFIVKWLGFILLSKAVAKLLIGPGPGPRLSGLALAGGTGAFQPMILLGACTLESVRRYASRIGRPGLALGVGLSAVALVGVVTVRYGHKEELGALVVYSLIALWFLRAPRRWYRPVLPLIALVVLLGTLWFARTHQSAAISPMLQKYQPVLTYEEDKDASYLLGIWAKENLPAGSRFIVPPELGKFRLIAERAIVVDAKGFPTQDEAALGWYERIQDVYGAPDDESEAPMGQLWQNYAQMTDARLAHLSEEYQAGYAVLYRNTQTKFPVLHEDSGYKIVRINSGA